MSKRVKQRFQNAVVNARIASEKRGKTGSYKNDPTPTVDLQDGMVWVRQDGNDTPFPVRNVNVRTDRPDVDVILEPIGNNQYQVKQVDPVAGPESFGAAASDLNQPDSHHEMQIAPVQNRMLNDLRLRLAKPDEGNALTVVLEAGLYEDASGDLVYVTLAPLDLTSEMPSSGMKVPVVLGLDNTSLVSFSGAEIGLPTPPEVTPYFATSTFVATRNAATGADIWLWALALRDGQTGFQSTDEFIDLRPYLSLAGGGGGGVVATVTAGSGLSVDSSDPANPEVLLDDATPSVIGGVLINQTPVSGSPIALTAPLVAASNGLATLIGGIVPSFEQAPGPVVGITETSRWHRQGVFLAPTATWEEATLQEWNAIDPTDKEFVAFYTGGYAHPAIGRASCPRHLDPTNPANWTKDVSNPVLGQGIGGVAGFVAHTGVIEHGDLLYIFFSDTLLNPNLAYATSADRGLTWTYQGIAIAHNQESWSEAWYNSSCVVEDGNQFRMMVEGFDPGGTYFIAYATATDLAGPWTFPNGGPATTLEVFPGGGASGPMLPHPHRIGGKIILHYHACGTGVGPLPSEIYRADSDDWLTWTQYAANPLLTPSGEVVGTDQTADPDVHEWNGKSLLFYEAFNNSTPTSSICLLTFNGPLAALVREEGLPAYLDATGKLPVANLPIATTSAFGAVKPDGTTITILAGVMSGTAGGIYAPVSSGDTTSPLVLDSEGRVIVARVG